MDIIQGRTQSSLPKYGKFYVKHLDLYSSEEIDEKNAEYKHYASNKGLPSTEDKLKELEKEGLWSPEKERAIEDERKMIATLKVTKSKFVLKADINSIQKQITDAEKILDERITERMNLVGFTSDLYALKKINEFYVYVTSFKDKELTEALFTQEEFDELHELEISVLIKNYNDLNERYNEENIKRVALSGFFLNSFYLCKDNPFTFYGKPVINLTFHQNELFTYGRYFKNILSELKHEPTPDVMDDPDKLIELFNVSKNSEKLKEKIDQSSATTIVGATQEDLQRMGITATSHDTGVSLAKEAAKKGGSLDMEDLIKIHGE